MNTPHMRKRFKVKPGITGLSQVSGRNNLDWDQKLIMTIDMLILEKYGFYDIPILIKTFFIVMYARNTIEEYTSASTSSIAARARLASKDYD